MSKNFDRFVKLQNYTRRFKITIKVIQGLKNMTLGIKNTIIIT